MRLYLLHALLFISKQTTFNLMAIILLVQQDKYNLVVQNHQAKKNPKKLSDPLKIRPSNINKCIAKGIP